MHRLVEIQQRRRRDAVSREAEIDFVQIEFEDLLFRIGALDLHREQRFLDLAGERHLVGQKEVLGDLLRDRGRALRAAAGAEILQIQHAGARDALEIEPAMLVEILVLGRDEGVDHHLRHRLDRQIQSALLGVFGEQRAVGRVHARHHRRFVILQLRIIRQVLGVMPHHSGDAGDADQEQDRPGREQKPEEAQKQLHVMKTIMPKGGPDPFAAADDIRNREILGDFTGSYALRPLSSPLVAGFYGQTEAQTAGSTGDCMVMAALPVARPASPLPAIRGPKKTSTAFTMVPAALLRHSSDRSAFRSALFDT